MSNWWQGYPWRLIQTNLREIDMLDISAEQVVRDMQAFDANILMINAAGIIASYPTDLPFHFQSPYLQGDSLAEIIDACHAADIRVFARTDFSKVRRPIYEANPEWAYVSPAGEIVDYNGDVACCLNGDFQQVYMFKILEELLSTHDFDGIFFNMGGYQTQRLQRQLLWSLPMRQLPASLLRDVWPGSAGGRGYGRSRLPQIPGLQEPHAPGPR